MRTWQTSAAFVAFLAWSGPALAQTNAEATANQETAVETDAASQSISDTDVLTLIDQRSVSRAQPQNVKTTVENVPDVATPGLGPAGTSPCLIATSAGVGVTGLGIALGTGHVDEGCEERNTAALLGNLGYKDAARAYLCGIDKEIEKAFAAIGQHCPQELAAAQESGVTFRRRQLSIEDLKQPAERTFLSPSLEDKTARDQRLAEELIASWQAQAAAKGRVSYVVE